MLKIGILCQNTIPELTRFVFWCSTHLAQCGMALFAANCQILQRLQLEIRFCSGNFRCKLFSFGLGQSPSIKVWTKDVN